MKARERTRWGFKARQALVPVVVLAIVLIQAIIYLANYQLRVGYTDIDDVIIYSSLTTVVFFLIVIFQRTIENPATRLPLQVGWTLVIIGIVHSGLINIVDLVYPYSQNIFTILIQALQDNIALLLGSGVILSFIGVYNWAADIRASERRFHSVVAAMPVGVAVIDAYGRVMLHNQMLSQILDVHDNQLQGAILSDLLNTDINRYLNVNDNLPPAPVMFDIALGQGNDRRFLSAAITSSQESDGGAATHIVVLTDMTTRKRAEEQREQQRRVIDLYASILSHDIGNDLQAVLGYIETSLLFSQTDASKAFKMLESAQAAGLRMSNLIKTFTIDFEPSQIRVVPMLREVACQAEKANLGLKVQVRAKPDTEQLKSPGGTLLPIAIDNILRNASEHAGNNPEVIVSVFLEGEELVILISDNGPGIPKNLQKSLFNRSDPGREGGLGLYLTRQIVTACGGRISLTNTELMTGATFLISLPIGE
ncbi:MAG: ATP-binding protein [Candidatus Hodarchaeota archaeon]